MDEYPKTMTEWGVRYSDSGEGFSGDVRCDGADTARYLVAHHPAKPTLLSRKVTIQSDWEETDEPTRSP